MTVFSVSLLIIAIICKEISPVVHAGWTLPKQTIIDEYSDVDIRENGLADVPYFRTFIVVIVACACNRCLLSKERPSRFVAVAFYNLHRSCPLSKNKRK